MSALFSKVAAGRTAGQVAGLTMSRDAPMAVKRIGDWIVGPGLAAASMEGLVEGVAAQLRAVGVPVDRMLVSFRTLSAISIARGFVWKHGQPILATSYDWDERDSGLYENSPLRVAHETGEWVEMWLDQTPDDRFSIVPDLKAAGVTHYFAVPMFFTDQSRNSITFATTAPGGFNSSAVQVIRDMLPLFTVACELRALRLMMPEVLGTYVGIEPAVRILAGTVQRGDVTRIRSAIMFVDMRDFTRRTRNLGAEGAVDLLNEYYDCVIPAVTDHGGTVLKLLGDGVLAIFAEVPGDMRGMGSVAACRAALAAAKTVLATTETRRTRSGTPIDAGIALHYGEAAYGNVGSGERLDFTIIGADVNLAHRIGQLNSDLGKPLLLSREFAQTIDVALSRVGAFPVRSFAEPVEVFEPAEGHRGA